jgi:preprotein translocase subunit SecA
MNQQREVIYDLRLFALEGGEELKGELREMVDMAITEVVDEYTPSDRSPDDWELGGLRRRLLTDFLIVVDGLPTEDSGEGPGNSEDILDMVIEAANSHFERKLEAFGEHAERLQGWILLSVLDDKWKDHLYDLDSLKASISFRGWGQKDPLIEYKKEAYDMFVDLMKDIPKTVSSLFFRAQIAPAPVQQRPAARLQYSGPVGPDGGAQGTVTSGSAPRSAPAPRASLDPVGVAASARTTGPDPARLQTNRGEERPQTPVTVEAGPGRNDPCPCGSGKKYKKCHGAGA